MRHLPGKSREKILHLGAGGVQDSDPDLRSSSSALHGRTRGADRHGRQDVTVGIPAALPHQAAGGSGRQLRPDGPGQRRLRHPVPVWRGLHGRLQVAGKARKLGRLA